MYQIYTPSLSYDFIFYIYTINLTFQDFEGVPYKILSLVVMVDSRMMFGEVICIIIFTFIPGNIKKLFIVAIPEPV